MHATLSIMFDLIHEKEKEKGNELENVTGL